MGQVLSNEVNFIMLILGVPVVHRFHLLLRTPHTSFGLTKKQPSRFAGPASRDPELRSDLGSHVRIPISDESGWHAGLSFRAKSVLSGAELQLTQWVNERGSTFVLIFLYWCSFNIFFLNIF